MNTKYGSKRKFRYYLRICIRCNKPFKADGRWSKICPECTKPRRGEKVKENKEFEIEGKKIKIEPNTKLIYIESELTRHMKDEGHIIDNTIFIKEQVNFDNAKRYLQETESNIANLDKNMKEIEDNLKSIPAKADSKKYKEFEDMMTIYNKKAEFANLEKKKKQLQEDKNKLNGLIELWKKISEELKEYE